MAGVTTAPATPNTIVLKSLGIGERYSEGLVQAAKTITPGYLVERVVDDESQPKWQGHSTAGGYAEIVVAVELGFVADIPKQTYSGGTIDDVYNAGDLVRLHHCHKGDELFMLVPASASAIVITDFLTSNGDGTLKKATSTDQRLFKPLQALDNSAGATTARIRVRVL
jgi:hypothetical protein